MVQSIEVYASLSKVRQALTEGGFGHLLILALKKLISPLLECGTVRFLLCELDEVLPEVRTTCLCTFRQATSSDFDRFADGFDPVQPEQTLRERLLRGDRCFVAMDSEGRVAHSRWVATEHRSWVPELNMDLVLNADEVYMYNSYTRPDMRGLGLDEATSSFAIQYLRAAGYKRIYGYVRGDNPIGLKAASRWAKFIGRLWYLRWFMGRTLVLGRRGPKFPLLVSAGFREKHS